MKVTINKPVQVEPAILKIHCKVCDSFQAELVDADGTILKDQSDGDYVPGFMPGDHCGYYLILDIDIRTGQIVNWKEPTAESLTKWINEGNDE